MRISSFTGHYEFLSNFYRSPIRTDRVTYPTMEHYFQAHKTELNQERRMIREADTPREAKRMGRGVLLVPDWEAIKIPVMRRGLRIKFRPGSELAGRLVNTAPLMLIEGNSWGDKFWGAQLTGGKWQGENWLGWLLMAQRSFLLSRSTESP